METLVQMNKQWREIKSWTFSSCVPKEIAPAKAFEANQFKMRRVEIFSFSRPCGFKVLLRARAQ